MRKLFAILVWFFILTSCSNRKESQIHYSPFKTNFIILNSDTTINAIAFYKGYYLCLQDNCTFLILDTNYKRQDSIELILNKWKIQIMFKYHDTLYLKNDKTDFYLTMNFELIKYKPRSKIYGSPLFEDSLFSVYSCCVGEFGGSIFFQDKKTDRTYSYMATCATQVLYFKNSYYVCNNLAHLGGSMSYLVIKDPTKLYELKGEKKNSCNWWVEVDSLRNYRTKSNLPGIDFYHGPYNTMSLVNFDFRDSIYSIICNDTATYIAVHHNDSLCIRDIILKKRIPFHQTEIIETDNRKICLFNLTMRSPFEAYNTGGRSSGLVIIHGNNIDILQNANANSTLPRYVGEVIATQR